jgi:hypothetical protein
MPRRNKVAALLLMPISALIWFIDWGLFWAGSKRETSKLKLKLAIQKKAIMFAEPKVALLDLTQVGFQKIWYMLKN